MAITEAAFRSESQRTASALRTLGERMATLEAAVQSSHEAVDRQMTSLGTDMRCVSDRVDKHETRLTVQEKAWEEQVKPAIARLDEVRMAVARSAWLSGGIVGAVVLGAEILAKFTGLW